MAEIYEVIEGSEHNPIVDRTAREGVTEINSKLPSDASASNKVASSSAVNALIDGTVGWVGKNEIYPTRGDLDVAGIYFKVNADKTVTPTGTSTSSIVFVYTDSFTCKAGKKYVLSGCPRGGGYDTYFIGAYIDNDITNDRKDIGNGVELLFNADTVVNIRLRLPNGFTPPSDFVYKPMICPADQYAINPDYEPHHESVEEALENKLNVPQRISSNTDLDTIQKSGVYYSYGATGLSHNPEGEATFTLFVTELQTDDFVHQILIVIKGTASTIYTRRLGASPATWSSWFKFTGTVVS